jgi:hypothetical protein
MMKYHKCQKVLISGATFHDDGEIVCENCGAAYCLKYLGMYDGNGDGRIDKGFEPKEWLKKYGDEE